LQLLGVLFKYRFSEILINRKREGKEEGEEGAVEWKSIDTIKTNVSKIFCHTTTGNTFDLVLS
jgi:hypothetical protein